ncbi:hypothetical protein [Sphingomonas baiyangensis]|nr:hypothetical protein [Sphingomonas baiyangensis]
MRGPDAMALLQRALQGSADAAGLILAIGEATSIDWASATFTGARHLLRVTLPDEPASHAWLAGLADAELFMPGHLLADCAVVAVEHAAGTLAARIEALSVEER